MRKDLYDDVDPTFGESTFRCRLFLGGTSKDVSNLSREAQLLCCAEPDVTRQADNSTSSVGGEERSKRIGVAR